MNRYILRTDPLVSVTMAVFNPHPVYFPLAVQSVLAQTLEDLELIIVEDPSSSCGKELLTELNDPRLRHYVNSRRTSIVEQRNRGLAEARGQFIAILDADDLCEPCRLQKQAGYLHACSDVTVLGSQVCVIDEAGRPLGYRFFPKDHDAIVRAMARLVPISHSSVMFRKDPVLEAGGYQYSEYPAVEDVELWSRLATRGFRFANHPEPLLRYRLHSAQLKATQLRGIIRGVRKIKHMYWRDKMDFWARARMWGEWFLLWLPPRVVLRLLTTLYYRNSLTFEEDDLLPIPVVRQESVRSES